MRYIFTAAIGTLLLIAALLALPPIGEAESSLIPQTAGDRLAVASGADDASVEGGEAVDVPAADTVTVLDTTDGTLNSQSREVVTPESGTGGLVLAEVLGEVQTANTVSSSDTSSDVDITAAAATAPESSRSLSIDEPTAPETVETTTTAAPTTTTTTTAAPTTTTTTTTTTAAPTTTTAPAPEPAGDVSANSGVVISARGVVLPIIGPASAGGWRAVTPCGNEVTIDGQQISSVDFVLDAGHGGSEPGAVGYNGATEKALNMRIAEIVEWYLEEAGYTVLQTRTTDIRLPLQSRANIAVAVNPRAFVSIHHNGGAVNHQSTPGSELFVDGGNPEARRLGGIMFEEMMDHISPYEADWVGGWRNGVGTRLTSSGSDLYGIHRYTPGIPSVITEVGYLSNPSEADLFVDNEFQWSHAKSIADALIRWSTSPDAVGYGYIDDFVDDSSSGTGGFANCTDPSL